MITIPDYLWSRMLAEFGKEHRQVEQVCYFDGVALEGDAVVTTLTIPRAKLEAGRFHVQPEAMSEAGKHLRAHRLRRLAQVHTHPTEWTGHSPWDNQMAYSQLPGAISIVLPHFGRTNPTLGQVGVHLRSEDRWMELSAHDVSRHLRISPSGFDFRSNHEPARIEPTRRRSRWSIFTFWKS